MLTTLCMHTPRYFAHNYLVVRLLAVTVKYLFTIITLYSTVNIKLWHMVYSVVIYGRGSTPLKGGGTPIYPVL